MNTFEKYLEEKNEAVRPLQGKKMWPGEWKSTPKDPIKKSGTNRDEHGYKDLGYANGWKNTPDIIKKCKAKGHVREYKNVGRGVTEYSCPICKYKYSIDSTD